MHRLEARAPAIQMRGCLEIGRGWNEASGVIEKNFLDVNKQPIGMVKP
jgi:hypothetical protein